MLDDRLKQRLIETYNRMRKANELLPLDRLDECYSLFRNRFGPEALRQLDGERLLNTMHTHGRDSLVYWLEFKNDEEFPGKFGSITGGSALKFGIYKRRETGIWMTGSSHNQEEVSVSNAIDIARRHRDQLVEGSEIISQLPSQAGDEEYLSLQREMDHRVPNVGNSAWGHKYFSLLFPDKLDDYHIEDYQRFHLMKLLKSPPHGKGRYLAAGMYVRLGRELGWPLNHLTSVLNSVHGRPYRTWRVATNLGGTESGTIWPMMRDSECVAIGWPKLGDLSQFEHTKDSKDRIAELLNRDYELTPSVAKRKASEILHFAFGMTEGAPVLAASGERILGLGRIAGRYRYSPYVHDDGEQPAETAATTATQATTATTAAAETPAATDEPEAPAAAEADLPTIRLAVNPWNGSAVNVEVAKQLLESELGYTVETVDIDENAQWSAINTGDLHASLEVWPSGHAQNVADFIDNPDGNVVNAGLLGPVGKIGWFTPYFRDRAVPGGSDVGGFPGCGARGDVRHGRDR